MSRTAGKPFFHQLNTTAAGDVKDTDLSIAQHGAVLAADYSGSSEKDGPGYSRLERTPCSPWATPSSSSASFPRGANSALDIQEQPSHNFKK